MFFLKPKKPATSADIIDLKNPSNYICVGAAGTGKSIFIRQMLYNIFTNPQAAPINFIIVSRRTEYDIFLSHFSRVYRMPIFTIDAIDDPLRVALMLHQLSSTTSRPSHRHNIVHFPIDVFSSNPTYYTEVFESIHSIVEITNNTENVVQKPLHIVIIDDFPIDLCVNNVLNLFLTNKMNNMINMITTFNLRNLQKPNNTIYDHLYAQAEFISFPVVDMDTATVLSSQFGDTSIEEIRNLEHLHFYFKHRGKTIKDKVDIGQHLFP